MFKYFGRVTRLFSNNKKTSLYVGALTVTHSAALMTIPLIFQEIQKLSSERKESESKSQEETTENSSIGFNQMSSMLGSQNGAECKLITLI